MSDPYSAGWLESWRLNLEETRAYKRRFPPGDPGSSMWASSESLRHEGVVFDDVNVAEPIWIQQWAVILIRLLGADAGGRITPAEEERVWQEAVSSPVWRQAMMAVWSFEGGVQGRLPRNAKALRSWFKKNLPKRYKKTEGDDA